MKTKERMVMISVPVDKAAQERLDFDETIEADQVLIYLNHNDYDKLWDTSIINDINHATGSLIGAYEDGDVVGKNNLFILLDIVKEYEKRYNNPIFPTLRYLTQAAIRFDTGVYFFF